MAYMIKLFTSHAHVVAQDLVTRPWMKECGKYSSRVFTNDHLFNIIWFYLFAQYFHLPLTLLIPLLANSPWEHDIFLCSEAPTPTLGLTLLHIQCLPRSFPEPKRQVYKTITLLHLMPRLSF